MRVNFSEKGNGQIDILSYFSQEELALIESKLRNYTGMATFLVDASGKSLTRKFDFNSICEKFRKDPKTKEACLVSENVAMAHVSTTRETCIYIAPCGQLTICTPIFWEERFMGCVFLGQALCKDMPENHNLISYIPKKEYFDQQVNLVKDKLDSLQTISYSECVKYGQMVEMIYELLCETKIRQIAAENDARDIFECDMTVRKSQQKIDKALNADNYWDLIEVVGKETNMIFDMLPSSNEKIEAVVQQNLNSMDEKTKKQFPLDTYSLRSSNDLEWWMQLLLEYRFEQKVIRQYPIMNDIFEYINENISDDITLASIVEACDISQGYLSKLFRNQYSMTVTEYIHVRKCLLAKKMAMTTDQSAADISFALGYNEPSYFSKIFRKYMKIGFKEYRSKKIYT